MPKHTAEDAKCSVMNLLYPAFRQDLGPVSRTACCYPPREGQALPLRKPPSGVKWHDKR